MGKQNYSCESSESCSLVSVTGLSANSSCSESCNSTSRSSCSSSSSSSCSSSSSSASSSLDSSSCGCYTEPTYSDNSTSKTSSSSCDSSSTCPKPNLKCDSVSSNECEKQCPKKCEKLVKKYNCSKDELMAIADIIVVLNFIKSKLTAVQPNIVLRQVEKYSVQDNINWLECFVDTLFCVLRKNEAYKVIKVKDCKLKNDSENIIDNRTYLIKIKYNTKSGEACRNIPLLFEWSQLTGNDSKSYIGIFNKVNSQIDGYIKGYQAASTIPFLC
jgi:hypothetical protein